MTKFVEDTIEFQLGEKEALITFCEKENIKISIKSIKSKIEVVSISNEELHKICIGVDLGKGQHKYYYIKEDNTILNLKSYFGWSGNGQPWTTETYISIIKSDSNERYLPLTKQNFNIRTFEQKLKEIIGIPPDNKKYSDLEDLLSKNKKLFIKLFEKILGSGIIYTHIGDDKFSNAHLLFKKEINKRLKSKAFSELKIKNLNNLLSEERIIITEVSF